VTCRSSVVMPVLLVAEEHGSVLRSDARSGIEAGSPLSNTWYCYFILTPTSASTRHPASLARAVLDTLTESTPCELDTARSVAAPAGCVAAGTGTAARWRTTKPALQPMRKRISNLSVQHISSCRALRHSQDGNSPMPPSLVRKRALDSVFAGACTCNARLLSMRKSNLHFITNVMQTAFVCQIIPGDSNRPETMAQVSSAGS